MARPPPDDGHRSYCPINLSLEIFGDKWTLLVLRDMMFADKRHFRDFLQSDEVIASNILADRLKLLLEHGIVTKAGDPSHKQKTIYSLTEKGIALFPVLAQIGAWGSVHVPAAKKLAPHVRAFLREIHEGGPRRWERHMAELRAAHLGSPGQRRSS